jgi:predicted HAD superfamily phosphohydrolase YqeG
MEVGEMEGVETVFADLNGKNVLIRYDDPATESEIQALLAEINYPVKL